MIYYLLLQLTLPTGFESWAQVLTDWRVSRAFDASRVPRCWVADPEFAAPFVAAISREICSRQLSHPPSELLVLREHVAEPTHERAGGRPYIELRAAMEAAQDRYLAEVRAGRSPTPPPRHCISYTAITVVTLSVGRNNCRRWGDHHCR